MPTYEEILDTFFFLRLPEGAGSYDDFERDAATEDRAATETLLRRMLEEAPRTATHELGIDYFPRTPECYAILDEHLTPALATDWMKQSNSEDENNHFKLTACELAVHLGETLIRQFGGAWRFARYPNYFQSTVYLGTVEAFILDMILKKCSSDFRHERIEDKVALMATLVTAARNHSDSATRPS